MNNFIHRCMQTTTGKLKNFKSNGRYFLLLLLFFGSFVTKSFSQNACDVSGPAATCPNVTGLMYTATPVFPSTYSWSLSNSGANASISGPTTNATVMVNSGNQAGSFLVTCTVTRISDGSMQTCSRSTLVLMPTLSLTKTDVSCFGRTDGTVTATFSGGFGGPYVVNIDGGPFLPATSPFTFTGLAAGSHTVIVKDANACTDTKSITVNQPPATPPVFDNCTTGTTPLGCNPTLPACENITAHNDCGPVPVTCTPGAITNVGPCGRSQTFTYTATADGFTTTCTKTFTWTVATAPVFDNCTPGTTDLGCNPTLPVCNQAITAHNECGNVTVICTPGAITNVGPCGRTQTFTYSATACGFTTTCARTFTWTVATAPVFDNCTPGTTELGCNPTLPVCATNILAHNECGPVPVTCTPGAITNVGPCGRSQTFTYSATACGFTTTCARTFTWTVATAPVFDNCTPGTTELGCNPTLPVCATNILAHNECGPVPVTCSPGAITNVGPCGRSQTFTYSATACGLTSTCARTFTWTVATAPVFDNCTPGTTDLGCNPTLPVCNQAITAHNECGNVPVICTPGAITNVGQCGRSQTFTYSATACGFTTTCARTFTWTVATAPVFDNCTPGTTELGCNPTLPVCNQAITAHNECGNVPVICTPGAITNVGPCGRSQTFTYSATACGFTTTCARTFTWTVATAPVFDNCTPGTTELGCNPTLPVCNQAITAHNECGNVPVICTPGAITNVGQCGRSQTFTYSATACGFTTTCARTFTWTVATAPVFDNCTPGTTDLGCNPETLPTCNQAITAHNECGPVDVVCTPGQVQSEGCNRSQTFTYTATACGLTTTCTRTFTWKEDHSAPTMTNNPPVAIEALCGTLFENLPWQPPTWTDNCGEVILVSVVTNPPQQQEGCPVTYTRIWTVKDGCENQASFTQTITVPCCNYQGCSPGFWKKHTSLWDQLTDYPPAHMPATKKFITSTNYFTYFGLAPGANGFPMVMNMHGAISQGGGACKAFSRHAVSALLSSASGLNIQYPTGTSDFTSLYNAIKAALLAGNCSGTLFTQLEAISEADESMCGVFGDQPVENLPIVELLTRPALNVTAYPNPYQNNEFKLEINAPVGGKVMIELFKLDGTKITEIKRNINANKPEVVTVQLREMLQKSVIVYKVSIGDYSSRGVVLNPN